MIKKLTEDETVIGLDNEKRITIRMVGDRYQLITNRDKVYGGVRVITKMWEEVLYRGDDVWITYNEEYFEDDCYHLYYNVCMSLEEMVTILKSVISLREF